MTTTQKPFIEHYVNEMDDTGVQCCIMCGEIISDIRDMSWPSDSPPPRGFEAGNIFIIKDGWRTTFVKTLPEDETSLKCNDLYSIVD